jgi:hypothetical protein
MTISHSELRKILPDSGFPFHHFVIHPKSQHWYKRMNEWKYSIFSIPTIYRMVPRNISIIISISIWYKLIADSFMFLPYGDFFTKFMQSLLTFNWFIWMASFFIWERVCTNLPFGKLLKGINWWRGQSAWLMGMWMGMGKTHHLRAMPLPNPVHFFFTLVETTNDIWFEFVYFIFLHCVRRTFHQ